VKRREFIALVCGAAVAWPLAARAQQAGPPRRIGWLMGLTEQDPETARRTTAVVDALRELGWTAGRNLQIDYRYTIGDSVSFDAQAAELVALAPDVLISSSTPPTLALKRATATIPIVFSGLIDPVASGLVANLSRPGGNVTGITNFEAGMGAKWLELLKQVSPATAKVALIYNPNTAPYAGILQSVEAAAPGFGIEVTTRGVADAAGLEPAIAAAGRAAGTAVLVFPDIFTTNHQQQIVALAAQYKVPAVYPYRYFTTDGGLISYGVDTPDLFRRMAGYVDRILKGEKPGDLPVQSPEKFEFVINLTAAKALGIAMPPTLLSLADEVIE
jgi:putative ABC transport system substrate-binding protein